MVQGSAAHIEYMNEKASGYRSRCMILAEEPKCNSLPDGFIPFRLNGDYREAPYLSYLRGRGVSDRTVGIYRMGYVDGGPLAGRVVIPSFDAIGMVNFWSARSIDPKEHLRYRLPVASKDIVSNEYMIDWSRPIYLVEGIFDEIAIGSQAISLYGKFMLPLLAQRLVQHRPLTHVCLDSDANDDAIKLMKRLVAYDVPCSMISLSGKDPASVSRDEIIRAGLNNRIVSGDVGLIRTGVIL